MRLFQSLATGVALVMLSLASLPVHADTDPSLEYNRLTRPSDTIGTLGAGLFGDTVDLYSGAGSFDVTDISIPGNSKLPVALGRHLDAKEADQYGGLPSFANWEVNVPYLTGYFSEAGWTGTVGSLSSTTGTTSRCSLPNGALAIPPAVTHFHSTDWLYGQRYWSGNQMYVPGAGTQEMLLTGTTAPNVSPTPTDGATYHWITKNLWTFSCLPTLQSGGTGEGFLATSPDGTKYYFDNMMSATTYNTQVTLPYTNVNYQTTLYTSIQRSKYWIVASHVVDRFGNTVTYTYDTYGRLTSIAANDGRIITITWGADGNIASASDGTHTWTYSYTPNTPDPSDNQTSELLSGVTQPDGSSWGYQYAGNLVQVDTTPAVPGDPVQQVTCGGVPIPGSRWAGAAPDGTGLFTLTATHPSGATGVFTFKSLIRGRSYDPHKCTGASPIYPKESEQFALFSKTISGPGLPNLAWTYSYSGTSTDNYNSSWADDCLNNSCPDTLWTKVTNPDGSDIKSIFGNRYGVTEGQLKETIVYADTTDTTVLDDATTTYWGYTSGQPFPQYIGVSPQFRANIFLSQEQHPVVTHSQIRDGVTFTTTNNAFDLYGKETSTTASSSLGTSRTDVTTYDANTNLWVIEQPKTVTNSDTGVTVYSKTFDPATALLQNVYSNGLFDQSYTFFTTDDSHHQKGQLNTVTDGNSHTTTLSNYYRGVPLLLQFPNGTSKTAAVDGFGHITGLTDEMGYAIGFAYDAMGRLATITQPSGDTVAWTPTTISFAQIASTEYGLPAGHWKQTIATGNATKVNYFDGFWQPVLSQDYDAGNVAATTRITSKAFDFAGRTTFGSYPVNAIAAYNSAVSGTHTTYDGLGRPTASTQDSELGALTTNYAYLPGFQTRVTNPRGYATTTSYQVFGSPDTSHPTLIASPEATTTAITRDVFGKPLTLTRSGVWNGSPISETRRYVYDANQRLCKRVEPETGATLMDYDGANNIAWTVTGSALTSSTCDRASVSAVDKTVRTYDTLNRPLTVDVPNSTNDLAYAYFNDGALQTLTSGPSTWTYTYNKRRLPVTEQLVIDGRTKTITHAYNALGQESSLTYPSGLAVATNPNALGQPTQAGTYATAINYFANGGMSGFTYGNGIVHTLTQNTRELPLRSLDIKPGSAAILDDTYSYDANANVGAITDGTSGNANNRSMLYDGLDRLTSTGAPHQWWINATTSYDALDNIRQNVVGNRTYNYSYDPATQRLSQLTRPDNSVAMTLGYDAFGNVTSKGAGLDSYVFDAANRMTAVTNKESYVYDGYGRRVKVTRLSDNLIDYPIYTMGGDLLTEDDQRSGKTTDYVSLNGSLVAKRSAPINTTTWTTNYEHTDALHSPITETDANGTASRIERYTPYGEPGDTIYTQGPGYTGHVTDALTGLTYAQQRYYDPILGRFLSSDPMQAKDTGASFNRYDYANDNPYRFTDPDGRTCKSASGKYTCAIDSYETPKSDMTKEQKKEVSAFNKSYTSAVNKLMSNPTKLATITLPSGKTATTTAGEVGSALIGRKMEINTPLTNGGMGTKDNTTYISPDDLSGKGELKGVTPTSADQNIEIQIVHEGLHGTGAPSTNSLQGTTPYKQWTDDHQAPFNEAANTLLSN